MKTKNETGKVFLSSGAEGVERRATRKAKIAFVGAGGHASDNLCPCISHIPEIDLVSICDIVEEKAKRNARNFGAKSWYKDAGKMIGEEDLDGVCIVGPAKVHFELGLECLKKGIPVFLEKPIATSSKEALELVEEARKNRTFGMTGFMKRFSTSYRLAYKLARRRGFGPLTAIGLKHATGSYTKCFTDDEIMSGLLGNGIHMIDLARFFAGDIKEIFARAWRGSNGRYALAVNFLFEGGAVGVLNQNSNEVWDTNDENVSITGIGNFIVIDKMNQLRYQSERPWISLEEMELANPAQSWSICTNYIPFSNSDLVHRGYFGELKAFAQSCIKGRLLAGAGLEDGYKAIKAAEIIRESVDTFQPIKTFGKGPVT